MPVARLQAGLEEYFERMRQPDGSARLTLRVPLDDVKALEGLSLSHDVVAVVRKGRDEQNLNDVMHIRWSPAGGGPYPSFSGTLATWTDGDAAQSAIELDGTYEPPLGEAGYAFDEAIGRTIAHRTARALLEDLAAGVGRA